MIMQDRLEAGRALARRLAGCTDLGAGELPPVLLALPRGGVPVALPIAQQLGVPLRLLLVRKLGAPSQPELALGAVVEGDPPQLVLNEEIMSALQVPADVIESLRAGELAEIERRRARFGAAAPPPLAGRMVILVDDGVATGATAEAALRAARQAGAARIVLAVPVIASAVAARFRKDGTEVVALEEPAALRSVGAFYRDFHQLEDAEVSALLGMSPT